MTGSYDGRFYLVRGSADGWRAPEALRDRTGAELVLGMHWKFEAKRWHTPEGAKFGALHAVSVALVDWDADSDLDLVIGTADGELHRIANLGTRARAGFAERAEPVMAGGVPFALVAGHAMPAAADWDQDGRFDLVVAGDDGSIVWARNLGRTGTPEFDAPRVLLAKSNGALDRSGKNAIVEVADLNGDGDVDLLVGDHEDEDVEDPRTPEEKSRYVELVKQFNALSPDEKKALEGSDESAREALGDARVDAYRTLHLERKAIAPPKSKQHARVWFYARRRGADTAPR